MTLKSQRKQVLRRSQQCDLLASYLGDNTEQTIPGLFVYGLPATGKTTVIKATVEDLKHQLVCVDCVEWFSPSLIFQGILQQLCAHYTGSCGNSNSFVQQLKQLVTVETSVYILFEKAERLRNMGSKMLPMLLKLQELTGLNVGVILESQLLWEKFREGTGVQEPLVFHMPEYSRDDLLAIMLLDRPSQLPASLYHNFLSLLLDVSLLSSRSLAELRALASANIVKYIEPIAKGEARPDEGVKLWRSMEPHLREATASTLESRCSLELPVYSKFLLIAAYLASYNPAKVDKRLFVKYSSKKKKSVKEAIKKNQRTSSHVLGPKFFSLDRLMAIFYSIVDEKALQTASIFSQVSSLVTLGLLASSSDNDLEGCKFKCLVSLPQATSVSKSVGFEIIKYLYDFL